MSAPLFPIFLMLKTAPRFSALLASLLLPVSLPLLAPYCCWRLGDGVCIPAVASLLSKSMLLQTSLLLLASQLLLVPPLMEHILC
jgi:hypothetical protein